MKTNSWHPMVDVMKLSRDKGLEIRAQMPGINEYLRLDKDRLYCHDLMCYVTFVLGGCIYIQKFKYPR